MARTADAIIIGAGVIGTAIAFELAKKGWKTLSLDRNAQAGHGSTSGSCAIIRTYYSTLDGTAFAWEGYHYWRDWADYLEVLDPNGLATFKECGALVMKTEANDHMARHMENADILGCPYEEWTPEQVQARLPGTTMEGFFPAKSGDDPTFGQPTGGHLRGAVFWPKAGYITDPALSAQNLAHAAKAKGAEFLYGATVTEILKAGGKTTGVKLADGSEIRAPVVINVAGPASARINALAGVTGEMTISTRALRQEVVHVPSPEGLNFETDGMVLSDSDIAVYCRPEHGNNILIGSEDPPCDAHVWVDDDTDYDRDFTEQWRTQALRYAQRLPTLGVPSRMKGVVDLYDVTEDWIPIYDKASLGGYYMACGTSGNQFKNAPIAGKMMAALVDYCAAGNDHDTAPLSFRLPYLGRDINVGFYSRKREINRQSSFSVLG
ncbi:MAG: FAD-dependent oxidoreductase [Thalassobaculaceae bacterium]|nr:FAD-dependent oxidoreductase [Thalassobaculaceae bacterium]